MPEWLNGVVLKAIIEEIRGFKSYSAWKRGVKCRKDKKRGIVAQW